MHGRGISEFLESAGTRCLVSFVNKAMSCCSVNGSGSAITSGAVVGVDSVICRGTTILPQTGHRGCKRVLDKNKGGFGVTQETRDPEAPFRGHAGNDVNRIHRSASWRSPRSRPECTVSCCPP